MFIILIAYLILEILCWYKKTLLKEPSPTKISLPFDKIGSNEAKFKFWFIFGFSYIQPKGGG